jgi:hypothetical protein
MLQMSTSRHQKRKSNLPRELPELPDAPRPLSHMDKDFGVKRGRKIIGSQVIEDDSLVDRRMTKIASTIDKLNR